MINSNIDEIVKQFNKMPEAIQNGVNDGVKKITTSIYEDVVNNCVDVNLSNHIGNINMEITPEKGIVSTEDEVIIYHEFGTGIKGSESPKPNGFEGWEYDINSHGEEGWWYPTDENDPNPTKRINKNGMLVAWTKGLKTSAMFYNSYIKNKDKSKETLDISIKNNVGRIY